MGVAAPDDAGRGLAVHSGEPPALGIGAAGRGRRSGGGEKDQAGDGAKKAFHVRPFHEKDATLPKQRRHYRLPAFSAAFGKRETPEHVFGKALVRIRQHLGITHYQLAKRTGRAVRHICRIEHGKSEPRLSALIMLAKASGSDVGDLVREAAQELEKTEKR